MIGGTDIVRQLPGIAPGDALELLARVVCDRWENAVLQDANAPARFRSFQEASFGKLRELFVFRDSDAYESWRLHGATEGNANTLVHLLANDREVTIVVDDPEAASMHSIIEEASALLRAGGPWFGLGQAA